MKKFLIAAGVASLLIAAQAMASDVAGLTGSTSRVPDRLAASYNASLNASTTQQTGSCAVLSSKEYFAVGGGTEVTETFEGLTKEECEARRLEAQNAQTSWGVITATATFTVVTVVATNDKSESD